MESWLDVRMCGNFTSGWGNSSDNLENNMVVSRKAENVHTLWPSSYTFRCNISRETCTWDIYTQRYLFQCCLQQDKIQNDLNVHL